jgi:hypothetical protein
VEHTSGDSEKKKEVSLMKKFLASILTVASLACIVLMIYFMLGVGPLGAALPIAGALVTAFAAGKLFSAQAPILEPMRA